MFIATRIANGIIAFLALFTSVMLALGGGSAMKSAAAELFLVVVFFVADLIFRKKNSSGDMFFAAIWVVFFLGGIIVEARAVWTGTFPPEFGGTLFFSFIVVATYGVPLLLNSAYLGGLLFRKRNDG